MRSAQQIRCFPLDVIDNAAPIEATVQADGNASWLMRHEAGALGHDRQRLGLLARFSIYHGNLGDGLLVGLDLRHADLPWLATLAIDFRHNARGFLLLPG